MRSAFISTAIELNYSGDSHSQAQFPLTHPARDSAGATGFKSEGGKKQKKQKTLLDLFPMMVFYGEPTVM